MAEQVPRKVSSRCNLRRRRQWLEGGRISTDQPCGVVVTFGKMLNATDEKPRIYKMHFAKC